MKRLLLSTLLASVAALSACGGSGGDDGPVAGAPPPAPAPAPAPTTDVPSSAQQTVAGLLAYMAQLLGTSSDTAEPILVGTATLPTDETSEPAP